MYILGLGPTLQAGDGSACLNLTVANATTSAGLNCSQFNGLSLSFALTTGISTIIMGLIGGMPLVLAPGITFSLAFQDALMVIDYPNVLACDIIIGLIILLFGATSRKTKIISVMPEDFRLGTAAGIGGLLAFVGVRNMNLVLPNLALNTSTFSYRTILGILGFIIITVFRAMRKEAAAFAFIVSIITITILSVIIRYVTHGEIVPSNVSLPPISSIGVTPNFQKWSQNSFTVFSYLVRQSLNKLFDLVATLTALILLAVFVFSETNFEFGKLTMKY